MISREEIQNLAGLARLELNEGEIMALQEDISNILAYVGQVAAVTSGKEEKEPGLNRNVMRADVPRAENDLLSGKREKLLGTLPKREGDYAVVRKIIQKDE